MKLNGEVDINLFKHIIETSDEAVAVAGASEKIVYINPAFEKLFNITLLEAKKMNFRDFYSQESKDYINENVVPLLNQAKTWEGNLLAQDKNKRLFTMWQRVDSILDKSGHVKYFFGFMHDASHEIEIKKRLKESEATLKSILHAAPIGIGVVTKDRRIDWSNERFSKLLGYSEEELKGMDARQLYVDEEEYLRVARVKHPQVKEKGVGSVETKMKTKDGKILDIFLSSSFISPGDFSAGLVFTALDITKFKRAEKEKEMMQKQVFETSKLASIGLLSERIAHEINNPLAIIKGNVECMEDNSITEFEQGNAYKVINKSINRIKSIVDGLRIYARADVDEIEDINVLQVIEETVSLLEAIYKKESIVFETKYLAKHFIIKGNAGKFQQVIMNLFSNAKDSYLGKDGIIFIATENNNYDFILKIRDKGCGIPKENINKIFDAFFTTKPVNKGTGLGLSITKSIVEDMLGSIQITDLDANGTEFTLTFPLSPTEKIEPISENERIEKQLHGNVLLVDDEEHLRLLLAKFLKSFGLEVDEAEDGIVALEKLKNNKYDYLITDIIMPKMDGLTLIKEIKKKKFDLPKVIVITGGIEFEPEVNNIIKNETEGFISKPFSKKSIYNLLLSMKLS